MWLNNIRRTTFHMTIGSAEVNRVLRRVLNPSLRSNGFSKFKGRCAWRYFDDCIWTLQVRAVGSYFSIVTGFPPMSLCGELCIFFPDFPSPDPVRPDAKPVRDVDGLNVPKPSQCHIRYPLKVLIDQSGDRAEMPAEPERRRDDVWYVRPDGVNVEAVIEDVRRSVVEWGVPLLMRPYNTRMEQLRSRGLQEKISAEQSAGAEPPGLL
jgi:hypothetical protein